MARRGKSSVPSLDPVFKPRSVAVIGASRRPYSIGREVLRNLVAYEFCGPVYPVNPNAEVVQSMRCYPSVGEIPGPVDLAVITVPRDLVLEAVGACGEKGVRAIVVITAGFREVGGEGAELEQRVVQEVRRYGMRMVGPNCMGVLNSDPAVRLNATFAASVPKRGNVGFLSQSGALGEAILADAAQSGLGVSMFVSMGNKADISGNDLIEYWGEHDDVGAILVYLESFGGPRRFIELARKVTRDKPILAVKAGRTAQGARAASSHTGSIVGLDVATDSLLEQCGVLRVNSIQQMFIEAAALANQPLPAGPRVAILTNAGGPGILCTDACIGRGLELAKLRASTQKALTRALPPEASVANPIDMIASADGSRYRAALRHLRRDPNVDAIISIFVSPIMIDAFEVAEAIAEAADGKKPVLSVFMGKQRSAEGVEELRRRGVPVYRFPEEAASAAAAMVRYKRLREAPQGKRVSFRVRRRRAEEVIAGARRAGRLDLDPDETERILRAYGFPVAPSRTVDSAAEAIAAAGELGYPVVLKAASEKISHKTDVGGVKVDLRNGDEVAAAYRDIYRRLSRRDPEMRVKVQRMIGGGREVILGMTRDPQFGPLLLFGIGGVFVELLRDFEVRLHPLTDVAAAAMVRGVRGFPLLAGARGERGVSLETAEEGLLRLSQLVGDLGDELAELDLNPFILHADAGESFVVDARIRLSQSRS